MIGVPFYPTGEIQISPFLLQSPGIRKRKKICSVTLDMAGENPARPLTVRHGDQPLECSIKAEPGQLGIPSNRAPCRRKKPEYLLLICRVTFRDPERTSVQTELEH